MNKARPSQISKTSSSIQTSYGTLPYRLSRSSLRRSLEIAVDHDGSVSVAVPASSTGRSIENFIQQKSQWIFKKIEDARQRRRTFMAKRFADGFEFLFLGRKYPLRVIREARKRTGFEFDGINWTVVIPLSLPEPQISQDIRGEFIRWYREQAKEILGSRTFHFSRIMRLEPKEITVRTQKRMWGCCHYHARAIFYNWQIIQAPIKIIDYVIVHELCHLVHPNHGKRFWEKVRKYMPDYRLHKKWLRDHQLELMLPEVSPEGRS